MADLQTGNTFVNGETITHTKLNNIANAATITNIVNADCSASMGLVDTKLAQITTASKVHGSSLTGLASIPSGAGVVPIANLATGTPDGTKFIRDDGTLQVVSTGAVKQVVNASTSARISGSTAIPADDTIPQNTEGVEVLTLAITPTSATNKLIIRFVGNCRIASNVQITVALFQDSTANALKANCATGNSDAFADHLILEHWMTAGTTSATTFKIRVGGTSGNIDFNGNGSARLYGGVANCSLTITEVA